MINGFEIEYRNPVYANEDGSAIEVEINHPDYGWILFAATNYDSMQYGVDLHSRIVADGNIGAYVAPVEEESETPTE